MKSFANACRLVLATLLLTTCFASSAAAQPAEPTVDESLYQGLKWRNIGPFRGGRSNASTGVPSQPHTFYFGGVGSGVWKTTDGGENWRNLHHEAFNTASVGAIEVSLSDPNVVYVGTGRRHAVRGVKTSHGDGVYKLGRMPARPGRHLGLEASRGTSQPHPRAPERTRMWSTWRRRATAVRRPNEERGIYKHHRRRRDLGEGALRLRRLGRSLEPFHVADEPAPPLRGLLGPHPPALAGA